MSLAATSSVMKTPVPPYTPDWEVLSSHSWAQLTGIKGLRTRGFLAMTIQPSIRSQAFPRSQKSSKVRWEVKMQHLFCCSVTKSYLTVCNSVNCSMPGFPVLHYLLEFSQTHVHWVSDAIQPSQLLSPPSPPALNPSHHQGLLRWVGSSHQVAKVLKWRIP